MSLKFEDKNFEQSPYVLAYFRDQRICDVELIATQDGTRYKIGNNYRTLTARINVARTNATTATCAGGIFVIGGISKKDYSYLNSVKFHVPASDSWLPVAPMNQRRKHFRVAIFNGELYVFGGCSSHNEMLSSIEKYNYQQNNRMWTELPFTLSVPRASFGLSIVNHWAFIAGGDENGNDKSHSGEKINLLTGESVAFPALKHSCNALINLH